MRDEIDKPLGLTPYLAINDKCATKRDYSDLGAYYYYYYFNCFTIFLVKT